MKIMKKQKNNLMKIDLLVVGTGNIAIRHIKNIQMISPEKKIYVLKRTNSKIDKFFNNNKINVIHNMNKITSYTKNSLALICSPASLHLNDIKNLASKGFNIFVEKPLLIKQNRVSLLLKKQLDERLLTHVGYNMRFTDRINYIKKQMTKGKITDIKNIYIEVLTDFRKWRKNKNYKDTVSFNKSLGGGVINELSHEVDYMIYLFGKPKSVRVDQHSPNNFIADVELSIIANFKFENNFSVKLYANMISNKNTRICKINTENKEIIINHLTNEVITNGSSTNVVEFKDSVNTSYIKQIKYVFNCLEKNIKSIFSINSIIPTQLTLNAMHSSLIQKKRVYLR